MFFSVARSRQVIITLLLLVPFVSARDESLFTSSVTYCAPPETLLIQQFDVAYIAKNSSILFNISAASVEPNVNVSANLQLNVYGMHLLNLTIDLCSLLNGALCPLPMYNFTGMDSIPLPSSLGISNRIPGIAYKVPDLEAFVQLSLVETSTGVLKACVQSTLSNGWSMHQTAVEWSTGALALLALLSALWQSVSPEAMAPFRLLDLLYLYQSIATTGFLNLNYPSVYRAFTINFSWAMGLFSAEPSSSIQQSINSMRHLTGGKMADAGGGSAVGLVNRKLSPYNTVVASSATTIQTLGRRMLSVPREFSTALSSLSANFATSPSGDKKLFVGGDVATVTKASDNVLQAGVPIYANSIGIATANAFMTVFFSTLILMAIAVGVLGLIYVVVSALSRSGQHRGAVDLKHRFLAFSRAWGLRLCFVAFTPVIIFTFYQWTLKDSWLSILLSVLLLLSISGCILYPAFLTIRIARRGTPRSLYTNIEHIIPHGPLFAQYRTTRYYFTLPLIVAAFLKAIFIAFAKSNGEVQVILMIVVEFGVLAAHFACKPYKTKGGDVLATYLAIVRFVCTALMVAFMETIHLAAIPRVVIGIIIAVLFSVAIIVLFVNILLGLRLIFRSPQPSQASQQDSAAESILEKGGASPSSTDSHMDFGRPRNPTPERNVPLDSHVNQPYPSFTPTQTTTGPPSAASIDTSSSNLGSVLPRRWSFQQSHSVANSQSHHSSSPHSSDFSSTPSTPRRSVPPSPLASNGHSTNGHSRQPTIDEHPSSRHHAL